MSGDFPCCEHCPEDPIHDVLLDEHDVPCDVCSRDARIEAIEATARMVLAEAQRHLDERDARIEAVRALHTGRPGDRGCRHCGHGWPCPTIRALDGNGSTGAGTNTAPPQERVEAHPGIQGPPADSVPANATPAPTEGET